MKTTVCKAARTSRNAIPFPNAATRKQTIQKIVDFLLMSAISLGLATIILFLLTL